MAEDRPKLLIVEDDPGLQKQLKWCFDGYDVQTADTRSAAIAVLRRHEPPVVLQDLGLPPDPEGVSEGFATLLETIRLAPHTKVIVVTGQLTNEEMRARSSIGYFLFTPQGHNETLLADAGFEVRAVRDVTENVALVSGRWLAAREQRRAALVEIEGEESFEGLQRFLDAVHTLSSERRLSRFMYLAER